MPIEAQYGIATAKVIKQATKYTRPYLVICGNVQDLSFAIDAATIANILV